MNPSKYLTAALLLISSTVLAQVDTLMNPGQYLYPSFTRGRVATKVGKDLFLLSNYNIVSEMIVFIQKGQVYDLADYHNVDTIYMNGAIYIPGEKLFFEAAVQGKIELYIRHRGKIQDPPKPAAYGGTSEVSSSNYISNMPFGHDVYRLKNEEELIIKPYDEYYILKNGEILQFRTEKQFSALFPEISTQVKDFVRKNKIKFDNTGDIIKLIKYCNSL